MAGGALFNNLDYSFTPAHPGGTFFEYKSPGGGSADLRKQLGILKRFLDSFDFVRMKPDASLVQSVSPTLTHYALVEPGKAYAIYLHVPLPKKPEKLDSYRRADVSATVRLELPRGAYRVHWINTKTGVLDADESFEHARQPLDQLAATDDIALRIVAAG